MYLQQYQYSIIECNEVIHSLRKKSKIHLISPRSFTNFYEIITYLRENHIINKRKRVYEISEYESKIKKWYNIFKDLFAGITDIVGGRSSSYERVLREGKDTAVNEMQQYAAALGANAIVGVDLDFFTIFKFAALFTPGIN